MQREQYYKGFTGMGAYQDAQSTGGVRGQRPGYKRSFLGALLGNPCIHVCIHTHIPRHLLPEKI